MIRTPIALVPYLLAIAAVAAGLLWSAGDRIGGLGRTVSTGEATIGGPFTLIDQDGRTKTDADFRGRFVLIYFGYSFCPDVCPTTLQEMADAFARLGSKKSRVVPVFITVDPVRDTPPVLKQWVAAFGPRLIGLTGSPETIAKVTKDFAVVYAKDGDPKATQDYMVSHSRTPYLFGPDGRPIALVPVNEPDTDANEGSPQAVAKFLDQWVK